jgi:hypothetical protein
MERQYGREATTTGVGTERVAAFSDGVIAIIITIMVLELKPSARCCMRLPCRWHNSRPSQRWPCWCLSPPCSTFLY